MNSVLKFLIKLQGDTTNLRAAAREVTSQLESIQSRARGVGASLRRAFSPSALGSSLMAIPGMQLLMNPYTMLAGGIGAVTKLGAEAEMTATAFTTLVGSQERAKAVLQEIKDFAISTPFSKLELTQNAQKMMNFGVAADKALIYLKQLGDISGGNSERLSSLSLVMGQVTAAGKLMGQDLIQFVNAGFNPLQELSLMTGKSYGELRKMMEDGAISAEHVAAAIQHATDEGGKFHNMLLNQSDNVLVRWQRLIGELQDMALSLYEQIRPIATELIGGFSKAVPYLTRVLGVFFRLLVGVINFVREWWRELTLVATLVGIITLALQAKSIALVAYAGVMAVVTTAIKVWTGVQWLLNAALTANPIGLVITAIGVLVATVVYCWNKFAGFRAFLITVWETFKELGSIIKDYVVDRISELLEGIGKVGKALGHLFSGEFEAAWSSFADGAGNILGKNSAHTAAQKTQATVAGISGSWQRNLQRERDKQATKEQESKAGISTPALKGSAAMDKIVFGEGDKKGKKGKTAESIATGGSRPTTINMTIGKLIETLSVQMMDKADTHEIERVVLEAMNRSLAIATSTE